MNKNIFTCKNCSFQHKGCHVFLNLSKEHFSPHFIKYGRYIRSDSNSDCLLEIRRTVFMNGAK